ncbi:MAG: SpoIIE family protein phosphatase, partial [Leptospiraceae bacterium]|nr:SpoIIE family protein phosphatase [Leptospiraceae bacterium]
MSTQTTRAPSNSYAFSTPISTEEFDFHHAITKKERSSRYLRTAIDYFTRVKGAEACDAFLNRIGLSRESSVFKHIYDDENWNSYALEVYLYDRLKDEFEDPYKAIWEFGVASGSGHLDQKDTLFAFKIKVAPVPIIVKKASEHTERMSLISQCHASWLDRNQIESRGKKGVALHFNYTRLPEGFDYPHWTSIVAGYGIVYGLFAFRKGLKETELKITHWPNLPSDLPSYNGKVYAFDKQTKNIIESESGKVIANAKDGPFELDGTMFNHHYEAICQFEYRPEPVWTRIARNTYQRPRIKREQALREMRDEIIRDLSVEHQAQLARYEKELSEKMAEIQALKIQQDGDYFLTSLLTKPLIVNRNESETVQSEFIVRQKKRFEFRNRKSELGGDICVVNNIQLQGRRYTAFVNGDAMGKSMQGAGGALVLGVVYNAFVTRTMFSGHQQNKAPEVWLRDCYYELQNVFISFDGSMFISVVMGLLDEISGVMYYINA